MMMVCNRYNTLVILAVAALACARADGRRLDKRACGIRGQEFLSGNGIGALRIGATVQELRRNCDVVADTTLETGNEGMTERRLALNVRGATIWTTIVDDRVWRIEVTTLGPRVVGQLGVGTPAAALRARNATLAVGEGRVFAVIPAMCGLSFQLADSGGHATWEEIRDSTRVTKVLAFGCATSKENALTKRRSAAE